MIDSKPFPDGVVDLAERVLRTLRGRMPPAAFVTEIAALVARNSPAAPLPQHEFEAALVRREADGLIMTLRQPAPDPHLESFDLRVVALVPDEATGQDARTAAHDVWAAWVRQFLANHRCQ